MKRIFYCIVSIFTLYSCIYESYIEIESKNKTIYISEKTKNKDPYFVDMQDIDKYVAFKKMESLGQGKHIHLKEVETIYSEDGKVSMYVIKYNDGWDVISADKRSPMVLASSDSGEFEYDENEPQKFYLDMIAQDIRTFTDQENKNLIMTKTLSEESNENIEFWNVITASDEFIQQYIEGKLIPLDSLELIPGGYWKLIDVVAEQEFYEVIDHLIPFSWSQEEPYNEYCPTRTDVQNSKAPAGCVAIAGAQMLAYLQDLFDLEIEVPTRVDLSGNTNSHSIEFYNYRSDIWDDIRNNYHYYLYYYGGYDYENNYAAKLISYIGDLVYTNYNNNESEARTEDLESEVFERFNINCESGNFNTSIVKDNLLNHIPVIIAGRYEAINKGHCFIIDGYRAYRTKYTNTYEWVYDGPSSVPIPTRPNKIEITYSTPYIENIKMNWGWNDFNDIRWYTMTQDWNTNIDGEEEIINIKRLMIYDFSIN